MANSSLRVEIDGGVAVLTLDAPEKRNAMTPELTREFPEAIERLRTDPEVRAVILTNTGPSFCAGGDLRTLEEQLGWTPEQNRRFMADFYRSYLCVLKLDVPTIAAINGHAIGAGLSMALGCDLRFAAAGVKLGVTYISLGLHPGMGTTHLLPQVIGYELAADLVFTGRLVTAEEGLRMGLVSRVLPRDELLGAATEVARTIASKSPSAVRMAKRGMVKQKLAGLEEALDYEATAQMSSFASDEMRAALATLRSR